MDPEAIRRYTIEGNPLKVKELTQQAVTQGISPDEILSEYLIPAMGEVGDLFERNEFFLPEMLAAALAMQEAMGILKPLLSESDHKGIGRVIIGTVQGDMHDIGKNMVSIMAEGAGFQVVDLGIDVAPEQFVSAVKAHEPQIVGMSALLSSTMQEMRTAIRALENAGLRPRVKVMVGGAPVTQEYADDIGADAYAQDAGSAVRKMKQLMSY